ncbi:nuclear transport factor 2 family protein [Pseudooceanicola nanhaiensis]|uniref:nuclear transport factor 2 family protein n=1 Tax=Pseudooceanicola nanhaiensis TaxID=375761 RepID=UPI001CD4BBAC|nr:nuclear transport factor 2 family protein [Pseudooceanicola nanhaiensis]MCA0919958.1 nuclear transport factor 2 family protein [Pseudooceanicola nanhaiensis]
MPRLPAPVAAYIEAYNAGDVDGMLTQLAQDALYQAIRDGEITAEAVNRDEFESLARAAAPGFPHHPLCVTQAITVGDTTALRLRRATVPDAAPMAPATGPRGAGRGRDRAGSALFRLRRDRIIRILESD